MEVKQGILQLLIQSSLISNFMSNDSSKQQSAQADQERVRTAVMPQHQSGEQQRDHSINTPVPPPGKKK